MGNSRFNLRYNVTPGLLEFFKSGVVVIFVIICWLQILKLYAWEESFMKKIFDIRSVELKYLRNTAILGAAFRFTYTCSPFMVR